MRRALFHIVVLAVVLLSACGKDEPVAAPPPEKVSYDSIGHYCGMAVMEHKGPKGQILLKSREKAVWFASVRDTIAYTMLFDEAKDYAAIYVSDMGKTSSWDHPENDAWVEARDAFYVIGSTRMSGMGAPETVPFSDRRAAEGFARKHGGTVTAYKDIPQDAVLGAVELKASTDVPPAMNGAREP